MGGLSREGQLDPDHLFGETLVRESSSIFSTGGFSPGSSKLPDTVTGRAGKIMIDTGQLILSDGALIVSSTARNQDGGNLTIRATDSVILRGNNPSAKVIYEKESTSRNKYIKIQKHVLGGCFARHGRVA